MSVGDANSMGDGIANNDYVTSASISGVTRLNVSNLNNIASLLGIEDFTSLTNLGCHHNVITSLDLTQKLSEWLNAQNDLKFCFLKELL